jgi:hypothetical protein
MTKLNHLIRAWFHRCMRIRRQYSDHPVVYNLKMKSIGIITGKLWLKLKDMQDVPSIADMYNIPLSFANNEMSTAFYDIPGDVNIQTLRKQLEADTRVLRVTLDMVDVIQHLK